MKNIIYRLSELDKFKLDIGKLGLGSDGVRAKAWLIAVWVVTLTECVQRCWL